MFKLTCLVVLWLVIIVCPYRALAIHPMQENEPKTLTPDIKIASMAIPFAYELDGDGLYNKIFNKLTEGYTGTLNVSFYPPTRYIRVVTARAADCEYIATDVMSRWQKYGIEAEEMEFIGPTNTLFVVAYIPIDAPDVTTIEQLKSLTIASDINLLNTIHKLDLKETFALHSQTQMLNLLAIKRITGLIGYDFDLDFLSKKINVRDKVKKASIRISALNDGISCFKTKQTKAFRLHLRKKMKEIKSSGWLQDTLNDY